MIYARLCSTAFALLASSSYVAAQCSGVTYGGICFPDGDLSFADEVLVYTPDFQQGCVPAGPDAQVDPAGALGPPQFADTSQLEPAPGQVLSLGQGGRLTARFVDNLLTNSGDATQDLHIFESGGAVEIFYVALRPADSQTESQLVAIGAPDADGDGFYELPNPVSGQPTSIDLDLEYPGFSAGTLRFDAVQLTDDILDTFPIDCDSPYSGADVDAIGAISTLKATYPGSGGDFFLSTALGADALTSGPLEDVKVAAAGDLLSAGLTSPAGTYWGDPVILAAQFLPVGNVPIGGLLPEVILEPGLTLILANGLIPGPLGQSLVLTPNGLAFGYQLPASLLGSSVFLQAVVVDSGLGLTATDAHEIRIP